MNNFELLCKLASKENWCWKLSCTTCGHMHFRYAFSELAAGKSPDEPSWVIHWARTDYSSTLGQLPRQYTNKQKDTICNIGCDAQLASIAENCTFPSWLGYLGLVLWHMNTHSAPYQRLSRSWANQLSNMVTPYSAIHTKLIEKANDTEDLSLQDLEDCEFDLIRSQTKEVASKADDEQQLGLPFSPKN